MAISLFKKHLSGSKGSSMHTEANIIEHMLVEARLVLDERNTQIAAAASYDVTTMESKITFQITRGSKQWLYSVVMHDMDRMDHFHHTAQGRAAGYAIRSLINDEDVKNTIQALVKDTKRGVIEKHTANDGEVWVLTWKD